MALIDDTSANDFEGSEAQQFGAELEGAIAKLKAAKEWSLIEKLEQQVDQLRTKLWNALDGQQFGEAELSRVQKIIADADEFFHPDHIAALLQLFVEKLESNHGTGQPKPARILESARELLMRLKRARRRHYPIEKLADPDASIPYDDLVARAELVTKAQEITSRPFKKAGGSSVVTEAETLFGGGTTIRRK